MDDDFFSFLISILVVAILALVVVRMIVGTKTTVTMIPGSVDQSGKFYPAIAGASPLPQRTSEEIERLLNSMPVAWIIYNGMTPPLRLRIRGTNDELYRRFCRKFIDGVGQENFSHFSPQQIAAARCCINAEAYAVDWEGPKYPNGNAIPFSPSILATMLQKDSFFDAFLTEEVGKLTPNWGSTQPTTEAYGM
jgi:hypothetical protein